MADCWVGLDLGQFVDYSAVSVLGRSLAVNRATGLPLRDSRGGAVYCWDVLGLKRFALRTPYTQVIAEVAKIVARPELKPKPRLVVDATGVGVACLEMVRRGIQGVDIWGVSITSGESWRMVRMGGAGFLLHAAKVQVTGALREVLESGRLKIAKTKDGQPIPGADVLKRELADFKVKLTQAANETFGADSGSHDDMVLSIALPIWAGSLPIGPMRMRELEVSEGDPRFRAREAAAIGKERLEVEAVEALALELERAEQVEVQRASWEAKVRSEEERQRDPEDPIWW